MFNNKFIVLPCLNHLSDKGEFSGISHDKKDLTHMGGQNNITRPNNIMRLILLVVAV